MASSSASEGKPGKKKAWFPDSLVLVFSLIIVAQILSYVIPSGTFDRAPAPEGLHGDMVVPGSFRAVRAFGASPGILIGGTLVLGKIPYVQWVKFVSPLLLKLFAFAALALVVSVYFGEYIGFAN